MFCVYCGDDLSYSAIRPLCERCDDQEQYAPGYWIAQGWPDLEPKDWQRVPRFNAETGKRL